MRLSSKNKVFILILLAFSGLIIQSELTTPTKAVSPNLRISTDKDVYKVGDIVKIMGNVSLDSEYAYDALVVVQVDTPNDTPYVIRTVPTGPITNTDWQVNITGLYASDGQGNPQSNFTRGMMAHVKIKWKNYGSSPTLALPALYIQYSNRAPYMAYYPMGEIPGEIPANTEETLIASFEIPSNAPYGNTTVYASMLTQKPKLNGYPYCPEKNSTFMIMTPNPKPPATTQTPPNFKIEFSLEMAMPGSYDIDASTYYTSQVSIARTFSVQLALLPPKADFFYTPNPVGVNLTTTFDGSLSLPEGYDDVITRYEWTFGDGTPKVVVNGTYSNPPSPRVTHIYTQNQTYTATLNVTDNEGFWNTTSKSITVYQVIPPTADFTWNPQMPYNGTIVTFDAGLTTLGWNGTGKPPIASFHWSFGDGNTTTVTTSTATHVYANPGNYTVNLTVTDTGGLQDSESKTVEIYPPPPGGNPDLDGNGRVDMIDLVIVLDAFGSTPGKPRWNPIADIDTNNKVDMMDLLVVLDHFGESL